jgi:hypothetical protein
MDEIVDPPAFATVDGPDDGPTPGREGGRPVASSPSVGHRGMARHRPSPHAQTGEILPAAFAEEVHREETLPAGGSGVRASGGGTVFHPSWRSRRAVAVWSCTLLIATLVWWTFTGIHLRSLPAGNTLPGTLLYPLFWATTLTWSRLLRGTSLTIGATGLVYATRSGSTAVRWRDVAGAGRGAGPGRWLRGEGLILSAPSDEPPEWRWRLVSWRSFPVRFIPLEQFGARWREGPIGRAIRQYAPAALAANGGK